MGLYKGAISHMIQKGKGNNQNFTVQCSKLSAKQERTLIMNVYDGQQNCKAIIEIQPSNKLLDRFIESKESFQLVITAYTIYTFPKKAGYQTVIMIEKFQVVQPAPVKKQHCNVFPKLEEANRASTKTQKKPPSTSRSLKLQSAEKVSPKSNDHKSKLKLKLDYSQEQNQETHAQPPQDIDIMSFQKIGDLYVGLFAWQILARVISKSFRDFLSKQNKEIQILTIELIDRAGTMIEATCFGEQAAYLNTAIKERGVYRIARGRIVEQTFSKPKSTKHSRYTIKLNNESSIIPVRDFPEIPYETNNYTRIGEITEDIDPQQVYNFVGILIRMDPERAIPKQNKEIIMQSFKIGDPTTEKVMEGIVWNRQVKLDKELLNKSVLLKNFKVNKYKDTINLTTSFKSQIVPHHMFNDKEETWSLEKSFEEYSEKSIKKLSDLSVDLAHLEKQTVISDINVWVKSVMLGAKWYYDSCPKCKKTATPYNICINCSYRVEQCIKRFLLTVELCDDTGSIFVTAFQDTASVFLKNATMQELLSMDEVERKAFGDKCAFECYSMKISSKKDGNGRINHNIIGRPQPLDELMQCKLNLVQIKKEIDNINIINISS